MAETNKTFPDPHFKCSHCGEMIDPDTCWCGQPENEHGYYDGHGFVPMGCDCYRDKGNQETQLFDWIQTPSMN